MRIILATLFSFSLATTAAAADLQQCRGEEWLHDQLVALRAAGKTGDEADSILAKMLMAQNPPALGLGLYLGPLTIEVYLLGDKPSQIVADCYSEATGRAASHESQAAALTADQRGAIGAHVRKCWTIDSSALGVDQMHVMLKMTTDQQGVARRVEVAPADQARLSDPVFHAFAERARHAVLDPHCASLPLPPSMVGKANVVTFRFSP